MPRKNLLPITVALCLCPVLSGCRLFTKDNKQPAEAIVIPPSISGTVAEYAGVLRGGDVTVQGYGLIVGLGSNGSAEVPPHLKKYLSEYLAKRNLGSWRAGTEAVTPSRILRDLDTAAVLVGGSFAYGAPAGTRFDVYVSALPQTQTRSLDGGMLMPTDLHLALDGRAIVGGPTLTWAMAAGAVFVNPFVDFVDPTQTAKSRTGRIIGGGKIVKSQPIRIQLRQADYARCRLIQERINERFTLPEPMKVASAKSPSTLELTIPPDYRHDYEHFIELVLHLPLRSGPGAWESHAREIALAMEQPAADHDGLSLVWEAMGRQVVPVVQQLYTSPNPSAAFYAARTGLRLGDDLALDVVIRYATSANSPLQIPAIEDLGRHTPSSRAAATLRRLIDNENELVRVAAYESLLKHGESSIIQRFTIGGQFELDLVKSRRSYVVYATQTGKPRIVLFGRDMGVTRPVFFNSPDDLLTINASTNRDKLLVFRKIPRTGSVSDPFYVDPSVGELVKTLGAIPNRGIDGNIMGLGLTYSQIVGTLYRMCSRGDILAKFVLQPLPELQRIYRGAATVGRPDMPGL